MYPELVTYGCRGGGAGVLGGADLVRSQSGVLGRALVRHLQGTVNIRWLLLADFSQIT